MLQSTEARLRALTGCNDTSGAVERLDNWLKGIFDIVSDDKDLSRKLKYQVKEKDTVRRRFSKIFQYNGPDRATQDLLKQKRDTWWKGPHSFWTISTIVPSLHFDHPQDEVVASHLRLRRTDAHSRILHRFLCLIFQAAGNLLPGRSWEDIAKSLHTKKVSTLNESEVLGAIGELNGAGSRYRLLESDVGIGFLFYLGQKIQDTEWEKNLPKATSERAEPIAYLKSKIVTTDADRNLRNRLVDYMLCRWGIGPQQTTSSPRPSLSLFSPMNNLLRVVNDEE